MDIIINFMVFLILVLLLGLAIYLMLQTLKPDSHTQYLIDKAEFQIKKVEERAMTGERQNIEHIECKCGKMPFMLFGLDENLCWKCYEEHYGIKVPV